MGQAAVLAGGLALLVAALSIVSWQLAARRVAAGKNACRVKADFLARMSHEIRTPLTAILGHLSLLAEGGAGGCPACRRAVAEHVDTISRNADDLLRLLDDVLDLSSIEAGKLRVEPVPCNPRRLVSEVVSLASVWADAKGLPLEVELDGPIPETILTDPTRLRQILLNLIGNAVKFTQSGKVCLATRLVDDEPGDPKLQFQVIDTGIGITREQMDRVFEPFAQADRSTAREFGGTGLGLAIVRQLATLLGGDVTASSVADQGSTFTVTLPIGRLEGAALPEDPGQAPVAPKQPAAPSGGQGLPLNCRILLVEDAPDTQRLISFFLRQAGAEVVTADDGQAAVDCACAAIAQGGPFEVILMDLEMPALDGCGATRTLRAAGYTRPIIALSAHATSDDRRRSIEAGCDDYLTKPIDRSSLLALVGRYASRRPATSPS